MRNLVDIYEKLDIDKVSLNNKSQFPLDKGLQKAIEYLKQNNFREIDTSVHQIDNAPTAIEAFNIEKDKVFYVFSNKRGGIIRFANTTSKIISPSNPCLEVLFVGDDGIAFMYSYGPNNCGKTCTEEGFIKLANKYFKI